MERMCLKAQDTGFKWAGHILVQISQPQRQFEIVEKSQALEQRSTGGSECVGNIFHFPLSANQNNNNWTLCINHLVGNSGRWRKKDDQLGTSRTKLYSWVEPLAMVLISTPAITGLYLPPPRQSCGHQGVEFCHLGNTQIKQTRIALHRL